MLNVKFLVENGMDTLSLRVWLVGPVRKSSNVAAFEWVRWVYRMADDSCHAGFVLFHGNWVVSGVVSRRRFENGSSGMNIRFRAEEMCCD